MIAAENFLFRIINIKKERAVNFSFSTSHFQFPISFLIPHSEEPITRSFHHPYLPSESTLSRIFLFFGSTSYGVFRGRFHNSQSEESCGPLLFTSHAGRKERISVMAKRAESSSDESSNILDATFRHFFRVLCKCQRVFARN